MLKLITSAIFFVSSKSSLRLRVLATMSNVETPANGGETEGTEQDLHEQTVASAESPDSTQTKETLKRPLDEKDNSAAAANPKSKRPAHTVSAQNQTYSFWGSPISYMKSEIKRFKSYTQGGNNSKEYWENLPLEKKREQYRCRDKFLQLEGIKTWTEYALKRRIPEPLDPPKADINPLLNDKISLWNGDITRLEIDAIVNAANSSLMGGGGVDGAIHAAASSSLREECSKLGGCDAGDAKLSSGHRLPAKFIIHTVGPMDEDPNCLRSCYERCLQIALENNIKSLAFCCIATGVYGFPNREAAHIALETIRKWLEKEDNADKTDRIIITTFLKKDTLIYEELLQVYFPLETKGSPQREENPNTTEEKPNFIPSLQKHPTAPARSYHSGAAGRENLNESIEEPKTVQDPVQTEITPTPDPVKEAQDPVEKLVQDPVGESAPDPVGGSAPDPVGGSAPDPVGGSAPDPVGEPTQDPMGEPGQDPVEETKAQEPVAQDSTNNEQIEHDDSSNTNELTNDNNKLGSDDP
ncbi:PREDICTED: O-acetyl-ADP-ribose deacetylase MACROD1-like isoform X2 [Amphimedon queenslandica]|uniref:Macro domain-containing protein n=1 Tax=Amphimedon queenslandica TaxID=400682 RepID=A0AAN0J522_AMPQE|nr:PREDICTED: O-acetyl-ADP-ribose deacetylase MACROD1-like isoform X2 [Amphimedon queenslandica]|eukprot:XP_019851841.1 PREDICTED: O-acetyl-ADP-ribose deacetylase MACROD1-like isoform X2 [Amphimedon queenslandica]